MQQIIYASRPFGFSTDVLAGILAVSRTRNAQRDITGALICRPDIYVQLLEGPAGRVDTLMDKIAEDDRHVDVQVLVRAPVEDRLFPGWSMKHDPAVTWLWTPEEIAEGALDKTTPEEVRSMFVRVASQPSS
ncbi:MAG: BLUF domain-containing protein [Pseudomonadota bacterium]